MPLFVTVHLLAHKDSSMNVAYVADSLSDAQFIMLGMHTL